MANASTLGQRLLAFAKSSAPAALETAKAAFAAKGVSIDAAAAGNIKGQGVVIQQLAESGVSLSGFRAESELSKQEIALFGSLFAKYSVNAAAASDAMVSPIASTGDAYVDILAKNKDINWACRMLNVTPDGLLRLIEVMKSTSSKDIERNLMQKQFA
jgi:hypothetical protein